MKTCWEMLGRCTVLGRRAGGKGGEGGMKVKHVYM